MRFWKAAMRQFVPSTEIRFATNHSALILWSRLEWPLVLGLVVVLSSQLSSC